MAELDRGSARRLELLLQTAGAEDHAARMGPPPNHRRRLRPGPPNKSVNPVALRGRGSVRYPIPLAGPARAWQAGTHRNKGRDMDRDAIAHYRREGYLV